jgi:nucleotide-binding universal stress UspA family protein
MSTQEQPVVVAYDGSPASQAAVRAAATLLPGRRLVVVTIWEPGLALMLAPPTDSISGMPYATPSPETVATTDRLQRDHAEETAAAAIEIARELGATADAYPVAEDVDVGETIAAAAEQHDAAAVVVGSRGLGRVKGLLGSTSQQVLRHARRPVIVVRAPE